MTTAELDTEIRAQFKSMGGWCDPAKGLALAELVIAHKPAVCVEIGVFAGKSLLALAIGLREAGGGIVYGIDSWNNADSLVDTEPKDADWWKTQDLEAVYAECLGHVLKTKLACYIRLLRTDSVTAAKVVGDAIDLLHIDGCHSEWSSVSDVVLWLPKLRPGGYLVLDDVNWPSTQTAVRLSEKWCKEIAIHNTPESVFGIYQRRP